MSDPQSPDTGAVSSVDPVNPDTAPAPGAGGTPAAYRVLARKYRPTDFSTLIGQQALVRTLSNAIESGRLAQAYVLTGVRGVGKTTTARIIARALNCIGVDGTGGPTVEPCGVCEHCRAIAEDRHVDVSEMDAASRTGVGDIRELIESVRYRPTSARYKIYIIDEVHMLSTGAFNALLKTLEEPPEHVKFIFATTEIRKVPVTVLSRCQRFDLRRVDAATLAAHFKRIADAESASIEDGALTLLARAADGSVRDGLSLLDQAIAHTGAAGGGGMVSEAQVRDMLGLADRALVFDLFDAIMRGDIKTALDILGDQYSAGADPTVILNDMLELTHWLTRLKVAPQAAEDPLAAETERTRGREMAGKLSVAVLTRTWQMLLKSISEARAATSPLQAVEMGLIRLAYAADLPTPAEAIQKLQSQPQPQPPAGGPAGGGAGGMSGGDSGGGRGPAMSQPGPLHGPTAMVANGEAFARPQALPEVGHAEPEMQAEPSRRLAPAKVPPTFEQLVALLRTRREAVLAVHLERDSHLVKYDPNACRLEIRLRPDTEAPPDLLGRISKALMEITGQRWGVIHARDGGDPTLYEQSLTGAKAHPLIQAVLLAFPTVTIGTIRDLGGSDAGMIESIAPPPDDMGGEGLSYSEFEDMIGDDDQ